MINFTFLGFKTEIAICFLRLMISFTFVGFKLDWVTALISSSMVVFFVLSVYLVKPDGWVIRGDNVLLTFNINSERIDNYSLRIHYRFLKNYCLPSLEAMNCSHVSPVLHDTIQQCSAFSFTLSFLHLKYYIKADIRLFIVVAAAKHLCGWCFHYRKRTSRVSLHILYWLFHWL